VVQGAVEVTVALVGESLSAVDVEPGVVGNHMDLPDGRAPQGCRDRVQRERAHQWLAITGSGHHEP
jgi:hypothetical protein